MNNRGLISSRSDVIALLSGELLQLRIERSYLFQTSYHWEPHYYLLTSIGILKFTGANMTAAPKFVPLKSIVNAELIDGTEVTKITTEKVLKVTYEDDREPSTAENNQTAMLLTSEAANQVIEWTEMIRRLQQLYAESKGAMEAIGVNSNGRSLFDNTTK